MLIIREIMAKSPYQKAFLTYFIGSILLTCPILGHADTTDGPGNAGVDACSKKLLERTIAEKTRPFNPEELQTLPSFKEVASILAVVDKHHPDFGQALPVGRSRQTRRVGRRG